jgi:DNA polymerase (family 10)
MERKSAAKTLREIGRLLEIAGENPHRVRAFTGAARAVETVSGDLDHLISSGGILEIKGIGKGTAAVLQDLAAGRRPRALVDAEERVPPGVRELLVLSGLGPKKVRALWRDLGVENLGQLEYACRENRLVDLKGFGPASQASVLDALLFHNRSRERSLLHEAWAAEKSIRERLSVISAVTSVATAGELRRCCETVGELGLVVAMDDENAAEAVARTLGEVEDAVDTQWLVRPDEGLPVRLWFARPSCVGAALALATGSVDFVSALRSRARDLELELTARGLQRKGQTIAAEDEVAVFAALDLGWIPPELRDEPRWLDHAARGAVPDLVELKDLRGALHNHTTDSDGVATLEEMARAAAAKGWSFFGVADHSPAAHYANGVDAGRLRAQWERADAWNQGEAELRILKGLEADILPDGGLDIPSGCDEGLDYVVASVHSSFRLSEEAQTQRLVAAVGHPSCRILGHPTGRLLLARPGYDVDLERVFDACAEHEVAVEINASPYRLDLDSRRAARALEVGLKLAINPDAHSVDGLDDVRWGVSVARRAGATADDVVNCDIDGFLNR